MKTYLVAYKLNGEIESTFVRTPDKYIPSIDKANTINSKIWEALPDEKKKLAGGNRTNLLVLSVSNMDV